MCIATTREIRNDFRSDLSQSRVFGTRDLTDIVCSCLNMADLVSFGATKRQNSRAVSTYLEDWNKLQKEMMALSSNTEKEELKKIFTSFLSSPYFLQLSDKQRVIWLQSFQIVSPHKTMMIPAFIDSFDLFAQAFQETPNNIPPSHTKFFFRYLASVFESEKIAPWIFYRILEKFSVHSSSPALIEFGISFCNQLLSLLKIQPQNNNSYMELRLYTKHWFGENTSEYALWKNHDLHNDFSPMPNFIENLLLCFLAMIKKQYPNIHIQIELTNRLGASMPHNFALSFVKRASDHGIFVIHENKVDTQDLDPFYAKSYVSLTGPPIARVHLHPPRIAWDPSN